MSDQPERFSAAVTELLDSQNHPLRREIQTLRKIILGSNSDLTENIKWNGPNYCYYNEDRLTMRTQPPKQIQLIFHRGAKKQEQPRDKLINDSSGLLTWKENDRAIATFRNMQDIERFKTDLTDIIKAWIKV